MIALTIGRVVSAVVAACTVAAVATEPSETLARQTSGTASLAGRVIAADTGAIVRGATVTCIMSSGGVQRSAMTDAEGQFACRDLPASTVTLRVVKAGFIDFIVGLAPALKEGQSRTWGDVRIVRGAVIAGRVLDAAGEPLADAVVNAWRVGYPQPGNRRIVPARASVITNDLGEYRLYGLAAGSYYLSASEHRELNSQIIEVSSGSSLPSEYWAESSLRFGVTYYPGTVYPADAQSLTIQGGVQALGVDMRLVSERLPSLSGRVVDSRGQPQANTRVRLRSVPATGFVSDVSAITDATGRFTLVHPGPGEYRVAVTGTMGPTVVVAGEPVVTRVARDEIPESAGMLVTLATGAGSISDLLIQTRPGNELRGRVLVDGAVPAPAGSGRFMMTMSPESDGFVPAHTAGTVAADGTFTIPGLTGRGRMLALGAPAGTTLLRVIANGLDVTDDGVDMDRGHVGGVEVHLTTKRTLVKGQLTDAADKPSQGTVIVFSENPALWSKPDTRYVVSRPTIPGGAFEIVGLPAGRYLAVVVDQVVRDQWADPENLLTLRPQATPFTVVEGETVTLALRRR